MNESEELKEKVDLYEKKMQKQKKLIGAGEISKVVKPLKWHYLFNKYLSHVIDGNIPQGTIQENNLPHLYQQSCRDDSLMACAVYLPPKMTTIIVQE